MRSSGRFAADITKDGMRWWRRTFNGIDEEARTYDAGAWHFGQPRRDLNFTDVESMAEAEFVTLPMQYVDYDAQRQQRRNAKHHWLASLDDMHMAELTREYLELVQAELAFDAAWKNKKANDARWADPASLLPGRLPGLLSRSPLVHIASHSEEIDRIECFARAPTAILGPGVARCPKPGNISPYTPR
jgi:hypothetical protein